MIRTGTIPVAATDTATAFLDLAWVLDSVIDEQCKSWPPQLPPTRIRDIAALGLNLYSGDLPTPVAILRRHALNVNSRWMSHFLRRTGAAICPHGKTTMAPQLFSFQLFDGAWGITVATRHQLAIARRAGVRRLILANEVVAEADMDWVAADLDRHPDVELYLYADSRSLVGRWSGVRNRRPGRPINLLLEIGYVGGRTGARTLTEAIEIAEAIHADPNLRLCGIAGFEGLIHGASTGVVVERVRSFLDQMVRAARACAKRKLFAAEPVILSAGGSAYYDVVADTLVKANLEIPTQVVLRAGCYLTQDHDAYADYFDEIAGRHPSLAAEVPRPIPALEVWATVQSRPEVGRAVCSMGKRDVSFDVHLPEPIAWCRPAPGRASQPLAEHIVEELNDQHAIMRLPENSPLQVGDLVGFGISHPCTTFDRWLLLYLIEDTGTVVDAIRTYF